MRPFLLRMMFTIIFAVIATALASVLMYTLPVLYYVGYQTQIPYLIIGFLAGALIFSSVGTVLTYVTKKPVMIGLSISIILLVVLVVLYKMSGPVNDLDLMIGSISSQSFAVFFASMYQSAPKPRAGLLPTVVAVVAFTVITVVLFLMTALIYLAYGQSFLPNIVVDLEILAAVLAAIILLVYSVPPRGNATKAT